MSNGNDGIQPFLRQVRIKIADYRSESNSKLDDLLRWLDDYERREVKEIKVTPPATSEPAATEAAASTASTPADPVNSGKPERV